MILCAQSLFSFVYSLVRGSPVRAIFCYGLEPLMSGPKSPGSFSASVAELLTLLTNFTSQLFMRSKWSLFHFKGSSVKCGKYFIIFLLKNLLHTWIWSENYSSSLLKDIQNIFIVWWKSQDISMLFVTNLQGKSPCESYSFCICNL